MTRRGGRIRGLGALLPPKRKGLAIQPAALFADSADIALAAQVLLRAKAHDKKAGRTERLKAVTSSDGRKEFSLSVFRSLNLFKSDDCQPLAALAATRLDDFAAAPGGHPGAVTNLAGALFAVRAECGFHEL